MLNKELKEIKDKLMAEHWTEDLHHGLEELNPDEAKKIVESMTESEIITKVNIRTYQEDYIADYLEFLWEISEEAFWKHVKTTLDDNIGLLWGDHMFHFEKLCKERIPEDVLEAVVGFTIDCEESNKQDLEAIGCVIKAQISIHNRQEEIHSFISKIPLKYQEFAKERIKKMVQSECKYTFY